VAANLEYFHITGCTCTQAFSDRQDFRW